MAICRRYDSSLTGSDFKEFSFRLMSEKNYIPDVYHDYQRLLDKYNSVMKECCQPWAMVDGAGKLGGVFYISDIVPGHEGVLYLWLWNPRCYTATTKQFLGEYLEYAARSYELNRLVCRTPDDRGLGRLLDRLGFKLEGRFRNAWKSGGRLSTLFQYRVLYS